MGETTTMTMMMTTTPPEAAVPLTVGNGSNDSTTHGCEERFTFGQTLRKTFGLLWERLDVFAGLYAVTLPFLGLYIGLVFAMIAAEDYPEWMMVLALVSFVVELVWFGVAVVAAAAIVYMTACIMQHDGGNGSSIPSFYKALKVAGKRACTVMAATMLLVIPEGILLMVALNMEWDKHDIPMCVLCIVVWTVCGTLLLWMFMSSTCLVPSIVIGHLGPLSAIQKSFRLACGNYLYLLCIMFTVGALEQGLLALVQVLCGSFGEDVFALIYLQSALVVGPLLVFPALSSILVTVIYISLCRSKDGGFSNEDLARELALYDNNNADGQDAGATTEALQEPLLNAVVEEA